MIKHGKVKEGETPTEESGLPCTMVKDGNALRDGEEQSKEPQEAFVETPRGSDN
jgi:hypothetical protein